MFSPSAMFFKNVFAHENMKNMKKPASKVVELAQIQPKSQFLFHKNLPPRDFSIKTLAKGLLFYTTKNFLQAGQSQTWTIEKWIVMGWRSTLLEWVQFWSFTSAR